MSASEKKLVMVANETDAVVCVSGEGEEKAVRFLVAPPSIEAGDEGAWEPRRKRAYIFACQLTMLLAQQVKQYDCSRIDIFATPAVRQHLAEVQTSDLRPLIGNIKDYSEHTLSPALLEWKAEV